MDDQTARPDAELAARLDAELAARLDVELAAASKLEMILLLVISAAMIAVDVCVTIFISQGSRHEIVVSFGIVTIILSVLALGTVIVWTHRERQRLKAHFGRPGV